ATEIDVEIVAVVDKKLAAPRFLNIPVKADLAELKNVDAVVITSLVAPQAAIDLATKRFGAARVLVPSVLANITLTSNLSASKVRGLR
ncbi:MAG TPA: hypothetical protein VGH13_09070, partial [Xanthobacteraceae bacterium]